MKEKSRIYKLKNSVSVLHFNAFGIFHIKDMSVMEDIETYFTK